MAETKTLVEQEAAAEPTPSGQPARKAGPIESRFLFVNVAALRAKQLRRGALPKLPEYRSQAERSSLPHKPERVAMEEVEWGLIPYELPDGKGPLQEGA